ncbi:Secondary metabolism regulator LAE1 [Penicillium rolfsii]|nr:Secondary metabolism regulator LAE1 [Penicillium rolfsii]
MADQQIEVDPNLHLPTQARGAEDYESDTTSIASKIAKGRMENGRRYQALKDDVYWSPSDEQQFEAFELGHMVCIMLDYHRPNPLFAAPVGENLKHVLDVGTGKGSWAIDVADQYPDATVRGVDLFPPPVTWVPPNCLFEVDDIQKEWTWREPFDLIHIRQLLGSFTPEGWTALYQQCFENLAPGGWIEQIEFDVRVRSDDGSLPADSVLAGWGDNFIGCAERAGRSLTTQETMRASIEAAGFVDVHERLYKVPMGPWAKDKLLKEIGLLNLQHWTAGLEGYAMWLLTKFGAPTPWTKEEVELYLVNVRKELKDSRIHAYGYARRVWARKPRDDHMIQTLAKAKEEL